MMKKLLLLMCLVFISAIAATAFAGGDPNWKQNGLDAKKAQALKRAGDYKGAAEIHPYNACKAWYLWNYACSLTGKRDKSGNWVHDKELSEANAAEALGYLAEAERLANEDDGFEAKSCDRETVLELIAKVRSCIKGVCP